MRLPIIETVHEALGFGAKGFETVARISWLPLLLTTLFIFSFPYFFLSVLTEQSITLTQIPPFAVWGVVWQNLGAILQRDPDILFLFALGFVAVLAILYSSFYVPLQHYAATGHRPEDHSYDVPFSLRHLQVIGATLVGGYGIFFALQWPFEQAIGALQLLAEQTSPKLTIIFPDNESLHTFTRTEEMVTKHGFATPAITALTWGAIGLMAYFGMRLFMWPAFIAAKHPGEKAHSLSRAWGVTKGWNGLRALFAGFILFLLVQFVGQLLNGDIIGVFYKYMPFLERPAYLIPCTYQSVGQCLPFQNITNMLNDGTVAVARFIFTLNGITETNMYESAAFQTLLIVRSLLLLLINTGFFMLAIGVWMGFAGSIYRRYIGDEKEEEVLLGSETKFEAPEAMLNKSTPIEAMPHEAFIPRLP